MAKSLFLLLGGLSVGLAIAVFWPAANDAPGFDDLVAPSVLSDRVAALESSLNLERRARAKLEDEVGALRLEFAALDSEAAAEQVAAAVVSDTGARTVRTAEPNPEAARAPRSRRGNSPQDRLDRLVGAGFSLDQAESIERRTEELRVEAMQARYEALREGGSGAVIGDLASIDIGLRAELGDADYERYLEATGRPTRVAVNSVLASSAAEQAGMQPGDEIYSYGGERVFDARDLNRVLLEGTPGEPIVLEVLRAGQPLQLVVPRGPVGITSGRFGARGALR